jgi:hypothetical protein
LTDYCEVSVEGRTVKSASFRLVTTHGREHLANRPRLGRKILSFTVHAGSLDDPSRYKPQMVMYTVRGHAWDHVDPAVPKFDNMPPM